MENIPQIIEIALLLLIAFLIGCIIGWLLRSMIFRAPKALPPAPSDAVAQKPSLSVVPDQGQSLGRPKTLSAPRATGKDDLKQIKGVGPKLEQKLKEIAPGRFDILYDTVGHAPTTNRMIQCMRRQGTMLLQAQYFDREK